MPTEADSRSRKADRASDAVRTGAEAAAGGVDEDASDGESELGMLDVPAEVYPPVRAPAVPVPSSPGVVGRSAGSAATFGEAGPSMAVDGDPGSVAPVSAGGGGAGSVRAVSPPPIVMPDAVPPS